MGLLDRCRIFNLSLFYFSRCLRNGANRRVRRSRSRLLSQILRERKFSEHRWLQSLHRWLQFKRSFLISNTKLSLLFSVGLRPLFLRRTSENGVVFSLKTHHQMFSVHTTRQKNETQNSIWIWFLTTLRQGNYMIIATLLFSKSFLKCFPSTLKHKVGVFKLNSLGLKSVFEFKACFCDGCGPNKP